MSMNYSEEEIVAQIQEYVPDLRKHVEAQIRWELTKKKKQLIQEKTTEVRELYMTKLQERAQTIKNSIIEKQESLKNQMEKIRRQMKEGKGRNLTQKEKQQLIEATVYEIRSDQEMSQEIKRKLYDRVEQRVFEAMEAELCEQLEQCKQQFLEQARESHMAWEEERHQHWRTQSARQLEVLAEQYRELECKKSLIQESLATKKSERDSLLRQQKAIQQKNNEIEALKKQIKLLA